MPLRSSSVLPTCHSPELHFPNDPVAHSNKLNSSAKRINHFLQDLTKKHSELAKLIHQIPYAMTKLSKG